MENLCCNKMSSFTNSSNSKLDSKLDSTKFETQISRGSQSCLDASLAQTPANFCPKSCFLVSYTQTQVVYQI